MAGLGLQVPSDSIWRSSRRLRMGLTSPMHSTSCRNPPHQNVWLCSVQRSLRTGNMQLSGRLRRRSSHAVEAKIRVMPCDDGMAWSFSSVFLAAPTACQGSTVIGRRMFCGRLSVSEVKASDCLFSVPFITLVLLQSTYWPLSGLFMLLASNVCSTF